MAHLALLSVENFKTLYLKLNDFVLGIIVEAENSTQQMTIYDQFNQLQREFQRDVADPAANVARVAVGAFTDSLNKRREKIITRIRKSNTKA